MRLPDTDITHAVTYALQFVLRHRYETQAHETRWRLPPYEITVRAAVSPTDLYIPPALENLCQMVSLTFNQSGCEALSCFRYLEGGRLCRPSHTPQHIRIGEKSYAVCQAYCQANLHDGMTPFHDELRYVDGKCVRTNTLYKRWCLYPDSRTNQPPRFRIPPFEFDDATQTCSFTKEYCDRYGVTYRDGSDCYRNTTQQFVEDYLVGQTIYRSFKLRPARPTAPRTSGGASLGLLRRRWRRSQPGSHLADREKRGATGSRIPPPPPPDPTPSQTPDPTTPGPTARDFSTPEHPTPDDAAAEVPAIQVLKELGFDASIEIAFWSARQLALKSVSLYHSPAMKVLLANLEQAVGKTIVRRATVGVIMHAVRMQISAQIALKTAQTLGTASTGVGLTLLGVQLYGFLMDYFDPLELNQQVTASHMKRLRQGFTDQFYSLVGGHLAVEPLQFMELMTKGVYNETENMILLQRATEYLSKLDVNAWGEDLTRGRGERRRDEAGGRSGGGDDRRGLRRGEGDAPSLDVYVSHWLSRVHNDRTPELERILNTYFSRYSVVLSMLTALFFAVAV